MTPETRAFIEKMVIEAEARDRFYAMFSGRSDNPLDLVGTVSEVAERWNKNRKTVEMAINTGHLQARQSGSIWLIDLRSAKRRWGSGESTPLKWQQLAA